MTASEHPRLEAQGLIRAFGGVVAVDGVSFEVADGEMVALIGPNGAGKSTCFNLLNGQLRPDEGRVFLAGRDVTGLTPRRLARLGVGRTFQIAATFGSMAAVDNVRMGLLARDGLLNRLWRPASSHLQDEAMAALDRFDLTPLADKTRGALAYGDVKRLELAVALARQPQLLLMDEPTAGMSPGDRQVLMERVRALVDRDRIAVLFTEHDMDAVFGFADRVLVMDRGALIAEGPPAEVRADPVVRAVYLGSAGQG